MIKRIFHIAQISFLILFSASVQAQFVNIRLELPAGILFNARVLDPREGGTWENSKAKVWVGIEAQENLTLLLDLEYPPGEILPPPEAYFLNDGSADFETAERLGTKTQELHLSNSRLLIRNIIPRPTYLQAWLGLPILKGLTIKIEYL